MRKVGYASACPPAGRPGFFDLSSARPVGQASWPVNRLRVTPTGPSTGRQAGRPVRQEFLNPCRLRDAPYFRVDCMTIEETGEDHRLACLELRGGNHSAACSAELPGLAGWVSCRPLRPSPRGGDLYYLSACSHGVIARVAIADVSGHGEVVSAAAVRLHEALRQ